MDKEDAIPEQGPERDWTFAYKHIRQRLDGHEKTAVRRNRRYKSLATAFHTLIPLLSIAITIVVGSGIPHREAIAFALGVTLTLLSTLNATLEPARRYSEEVEQCIELHDLRLRAEMGVEDLKNTHATQTEMLSFLSDINLDISQIGRRLASIPIPRLVNDLGRDKQSG